MQKTALITGGAQRIGKAMAVHLAANGWSVAIHYNRSEAPAKELTDSLTQHYPGQSFYPFGADLTRDSEIEQLIPKVIDIMGVPSLLINNASVFEPKMLKETSIAFFDEQITVNFKAPFILSRDFANLSKSGNIINFVDTRVTTNKSNFAAYTLAKKALWELTKMSAFELGPEIRVNAIAPGLTLAPVEKGEDYLWKLAKHIPIQRPGGIEPILKSLDFILGNDYLTGQLLFCDGGENIGYIG
jgi:NAD(P)-dependent dehydrogenase (short-subunit alcohol dehydrogenase family)